NMGKYNSGSDQVAAWLQLSSQSCEGTSNSFLANWSQRIYGAASYWNGNIYIGGVGGPLRSLRFSGSALTETSHTATIFENGAAFGSANADGQKGRGPMSTVSSSGATNALVWAVSKKQQPDPTLDRRITLHAYDATDLSKEL